MSAKPLHEGTYGVVPVTPLLDVNDLSRIDTHGPESQRGLAARQPAPLRRLAERRAVRLRSSWDPDDEAQGHDGERKDASGQWLAQRPRRHGLAWYAPPIPWHSAGLAQAGLLNPLAVSGRPITDGPVIGRSVVNGNLFRFDAWSPYNLDGTDANGVIIGQMGSGKSMLLKGWAARETCEPWHRRVIIEGDPNSEWAVVAQSVGGQTITIGDGSYLNPLDPGTRPETAGTRQWASTVLGVQRAAMESIAAALDNGGQLGTDDKALIDASLADFQRRGATPCVAGLVDRWQNGEWLSGLGIPGLDSTQTQDTARRMTLLFGQMVTGAAAGAFERESTVHIDPASPMTVFDTGSVDQRDPFKKALWTASMNAAVEQLCARDDGEFRLVIAEEGHQLLKSPQLVKAWDNRMRESGHLGVANWLLVHDLADVEKFADQGTEHWRLMQDAITLSGTKVVFSQSDASLASMERLLPSLSENELAVLRSLPRHTALWRIGPDIRDEVIAEFGDEAMQAWSTTARRAG